MTISVNTPDGGTAQFPDGTHPEVMQAALRQKFPAPATDPGSPAPNFDTSGVGGALYAGVHNLEDMATLGQGDKIAAALSTGVRTAIGLPADYDSAYKQIQATANSANDQHPLARFAGDVGGLVAGGGVIGSVLKLGERVGLRGLSDALSATTRDASGLPLKASGMVANVAKSAAANAAVGTGVGLASGQDPGSALLTGAVSAVAGPTVGKAAEFGIAKLGGASQRAMQVLADTLGETSDTVEKAYNFFVNATGATPSMAQLATLKAQGRLRELAAANATIGEGAVRAANMASAPLHEQLAATAGATKPQTDAAFAVDRDNRMTAMMSHPHPVTGQVLKDVPLSDPTGILTDPHVEFALRPNTQVNARLGQQSPILDRITGDQATIGDAESIRKALRDQQNGFMRPAPGSSASKDPILAKEFGDVANKVETLAMRASPEYGNALNTYRAQSRYADGFSHGRTGGAFDDYDESDSKLRAALQTPEGVAGYEHGNTLFTAEQTLNHIAPGMVKPQSAFGAPQAAQAGAALATFPSPWFASHIARAVPGMHESEAVQRMVTEQLNSHDPQVVKQGMANINRYRKIAAANRLAAASVGASTGYGVGEMTSGGGQPQ